MKFLKSSGTTLFELLIVLTVFVIVVAIANQVFFSTLKGSSKSEVTSFVKQEANYAASVIERALHSASSVVSCDGTSVTYLDADGRQTSFSCENVGDAGYVASGSARLTSDKVAVASCSFSCSSDSGVTTAVILDMFFRQAATGAGLRPEEKSLYQLKTRVLLRN